MFIFNHFRVQVSGGQVVVSFRYYNYNRSKAVSETKHETANARYITAPEAKREAVTNLYSSVYRALL
jgi:hypothetical protein